MPRLCRLLAVFLIAGGVACSGRIDQGSSPGGAGGTTTAPVSCDVGTGRLCGGECGVCAGSTSCLKMYQRDSSPGYGLCGDATANAHLAGCTACLEGDACSLINPRALECVPKAVCDEKLLVGESGCFFPDKTAYTAASIPDPAQCPVAVTGAPPFCAGSCGACPTGLTCTGRSPTHPVGLCLPFVKLGQPVSPNSLCSKDAPCETGALCFVYTTNPADTPFAQEYGMCIDAAVCPSLASTLQGGGACLDGSGAVVAGQL